MFQPWPFRHNINKNQTQNKRQKTKMVQRGAQYNCIEFLLYIRKPIKNMYNQKNLKIVA